MIACPDVGRHHGILINKRYELQAATADSADVNLATAVVAERLTRRLDATRYRGVRDEAAVPNVLDDDVSGDDLSGALDEETQQVENQRLYVDVAGAQPQRELQSIQLEPIEAVPHGVLRQWLHRAVGVASG